MTENYAQYLAALAIRDATITNLVTIAAGYVLSWMALSILPWRRLAGLLRRAYLVCGLIGWLAIILLSL